ncbi:hypothetical protein HHA02_20680 [Cobetia marina]|jgi:hypothetical protein|nr:hypothetical protein HHA02_20680 [Cobetia marina]
MLARHDMTAPTRHLRRLPIAGSRGRAADLIPTWMLAPRAVRLPFLTDPPAAVTSHPEVPASLPGA